MNILLAPDSFKGSIRATEICNIFQRTATYHQLRTLPLADGGEGSLQTIAHHPHFKKIEKVVQGPLFEEIAAHYLFDTEMNVAYIELAEASGIEHISPTETSCSKTTTLGTGQLLADAIRLGAEKIVLFVGGSATNDAAMGIAVALGFRFLDSSGHELSPIGENLTKVVFIDDSRAQRTDDIEFLVATDVHNVFHGAHGAAHVYAKQKGASPQQIIQLDNGLKHLNKCIGDKYNLDLQLLPGAGAAGGVAGGMAAFFGAELEAGTKLIFEANQLYTHLQWADVVITGEGKTDTQTLQGKLVGQVLELAQEHQTKAILLCGFLDGDKLLAHQLGVDSVFQLAKNKADIPSAIEQVQQRTEQTAREIFTYIDTLS